jgi:hypothetical protein
VVAVRSGRYKTFEFRGQYFVAAGHLEVDLLLEQNRVLAQQLADGGSQCLGQRREPGMVGGDVLDAADDLLVRLEGAVFPVDPMPARFLGHPGQFPGPGFDGPHLAGVEGGTDDEVAVVPEVTNLPAGSSVPNLGRTFGWSMVRPAGRVGMFIRRAAV